MGRIYIWKILIILSIIIVFLQENIANALIITYSNWSFSKLSALSASSCLHLSSHLLAVISLVWGCIFQSAWAHLPKDFSSFPYSFTCVLSSFLLSLLVQTHLLPLDSSWLNWSIRRVLPSFSWEQSCIVTQKNYSLRLKSFCLLSRNLCFSFS